jgi:hypothetical protein
MVPHDYAAHSSQIISFASNHTTAVIKAFYSGKHRLWHAGCAGCPVRGSRHILPTCSRKHLPGGSFRAAEMAERGGWLVCVSGVNDAFVMDAWAQSVGATGERPHVI